MFLPIVFLHLLLSTLLTQLHLTLTSTLTFDPNPISSFPPLIYLLKSTPFSLLPYSINPIPSTSTFESNSTSPPSTLSVLSELYPLLIPGEFYPISTLLTPPLHTQPISLPIWVLWWWQDSVAIQPQFSASKWTSISTRSNKGVHCSKAMELLLVFRLFPFVAKRIIYQLYFHSVIFGFVNLKSIFLFIIFT